MVFHKSDIINGKNSIREIKIEKLNNTLKLRPLTDGEVQEINRMMTQGGLKPLKGKIETDKIRKKKGTGNDIDYEVDPMLSAESSYNADVKAVFYSLRHEEDTDNWSEEDIKGFPAGAVEETALQVYKISGIDDPNKTRNDMINFREKE